MSEIPSHSLPPYSEDSRDDALFHYTSADGLIGILQNGEIWGTAYYCSNDESELTAGKGILRPVFSGATDKMVQDNDPLVQTFRGRGADIMECAGWFEGLIIAITFSKLSAYITCFCKPTGEEDFLHGLLSQWRAYGVDGGGYALQFSRKKLLAAVEKANETQGLHYELHDVHYTVENPLKSEVLSHTDAFLRAYKNCLEELGAPLHELFDRKSTPNPIVSLLGGPLESLLDYLIHTKNQHFGEESECRLSLIEGVSSEVQVLPMNYFNRGGLIVPYKKTPRTLPLLDCVEWIVIGPNPRMGARFKSVTQMVQAAGLAIEVRPSHIPYRGSHH